jgi:hypothetical protein
LHIGMMIGMPSSLVHSGIRYSNTQQKQTCAIIRQLIGNRAQFRPVPQKGGGDGASLHPQWSEQA